MDTAGNGTRSSFRLASGMDLLDKWEKNATQHDKNMVHRALFATVSKTVFSEYLIVDDATKTMEFFVMVKGDLTIKIRVHGLDSFGIIYVGSTSEAPGFDRARPVQEASAAGSVAE